jgi:predicted nucleic-acid-binding protein
MKAAIDIKVTVDTNVLIRAVVRDDLVQATRLLL